MQFAILGLVFPHFSPSSLTGLFLLLLPLPPLFLPVATNKQFHSLPLYNNLVCHSFQTSFIKETSLIYPFAHQFLNHNTTMLGKTLLACATFVVAAVAQSQIIAFTNPPSKITAGKPIELTWAGGDNSVCLSET